MVNCKEEFLSEVESKNVICCYIKHNENTYILKTGFSQNDYDEFLREIDFEYDNGYGGQEVYGIIWYGDKSWSERGEYDGSEWWEHIFRPSIPKRLRGDK